MKAKLKKVLEDKLARDILDFFYQNQGCIDSVGGITAWVNSDRSKVKEVLDSLVELGILQHDAEGITEGYCYTRDEDIMRDVKEALEG